MSSSPPNSNPLVPVVHIGINKTATTLLQEHLFPNHPQVKYLGKFIGHGCRYPDPDINELLDRIVRKPLNRVKVESCRQIFDRCVAPSLNAGQIPVWSLENLCQGNLNRRRYLAENIKEVFRDCKIIVCLREPLSLMQSLYFQRLKNSALVDSLPAHKQCRYYSVDQWLGENWKERGWREGFSELDYARTIELYCDLFGVESIGVFIFEQFKQDWREFISRFCSSIGLDPQESVEAIDDKRSNVRMSVPQVDWLKSVAGNPIKRWFFMRRSERWRRRYFSSIGRFNGREKVAQVEISDQWRHRILDHTREGNRWLVENWGLPLEEFGYPI